MGKTIIEKILSAHSGEPAAPGDIVDLGIDVRVARDFGGANVVKNLRDRGLGVADPSKTFFTFDCNPGGSDQKYATNQQVCRVFGREHGLRTYDIDQGIGTHVAIDEGLAVPGSTWCPPTRTPTSSERSALSAKAWAISTSPTRSPSDACGSRCLPR
jgi:3-isopropylmalate/(R)-2-methylmalate dehydratase large subunit